MLGAEIEGLGVATLAQVPDVELVTILVAQQQLRTNPALDHIGGAPLAGDHRVVPEVPPEVVGEELVPAIDLPAAEHVEALMIEHEDAARAAAVRRPERAEVDPIRTAVAGVRPTVAG